MAEAEVPQEPSKVEAPRSRILALLSHPAVVVLGIIGAIASLIGIPLSVYLYYASREYPQLAYYVHPVKATVVRAGEASRLAAIFDNRPVETDITAAQIAIWNQGQQAIKKDDVLKPIIIFTENNTPILEATIRKSSREVIQLGLNTDELQNGRVTVTWNILENSDGGVIQLIYAGNTDIQITADGIVEGQQQIEKLEFTGKIKSPYEQYEAERWSYRYLGYLSIAFGAVLIWGARGVVKTKYQYRSGVEGNVEALESYINSLDRRIAFENKLVKTSDGFIADIERQIRELEEHSSSFRTEDFESLKEGQLQRIKEHRKEQQESKERIKEYEPEREELIAEKAKAYQDSKKKEGWFDLTAAGLTLLGLLAFVPAIYLLFIAHPAGPPFGF